MIVYCDMAGIVTKINVTPGERVESGQEVVVLESMKMQIPVASPASGQVKAIHVKEGDFVNEGDPLLEID